MLAKRPQRTIAIKGQQATSSAALTAAAFTAPAVTAAVTAAAVTAAAATATALRPTTEATAAFGCAAASATALAGNAFHRTGIELGGHIWTNTPAAPTMVRLEHNKSSQICSSQGCCKPQRCIESYRHQTR